MGKGSRNRYRSSIERADTWTYRYGRLGPVEIRKAVEPLTKRLSEYDNARLVLEESGGHLNDLEAMTKLLSDEFLLSAGDYVPTSMSLSEPENVRKTLTSIDYDLHLDIRVSEAGLPLYYLCRVENDYWREYSLIVEDLHMSPGYQLPDDRFAKLMRAGRELYFIRLSQFREALAGMLSRIGNGSDELTVDSFLYDIGRYVFQGAWHEDQHLSVWVADVFGLPHFRQAVELLYLSLSTDLCELRNVTSPDMARFFRRIYHQPAIAEFLKTLDRLDGGALTQRPQLARQSYAGLAKEFSRFLATEVVWGRRKIRLPLWKLVYANLSRLSLVPGEIGSSQSLAKSCRDLEKTAKAGIERLLNF